MFELLETVNQSWSKVCQNFSRIMLHNSPVKLYDDEINLHSVHPQTLYGSRSWFSRQLFP